MVIKYIVEAVIVIPLVFVPMCFSTASNDFVPFSASWGLLSLVV